LTYKGQGNLDNLTMDLYLGAIPSFYFYRDGQYIDRVISGSYLKLENFIDTYYIGPIHLQEAIIDRSNPAISFFNEDEENSTKILAVFKCSLFDQFGHRTKDCTEKPAKTDKPQCSNCGKMHPVWDIKCMGTKKNNLIESLLMIQKNKKDRKNFNANLNDNE
jgi:hypothetical protein